MKRWIVKLALTAILGLGTTVLVAWALAMGVAPSWRSYDYLLPRTLRPPFIEVYSQRAFGTERRILASADLIRDGLMNLPDTPQEANRWASGTLQFAAREGVFPAWWGRPPDQHAMPGTSVWAGSIQDGRGWPLIALWCEWPIASPALPTLSASGAPLAVRGGIELSPTERYYLYAVDLPRALPLRPVWAGLAANTVVYGVLWWMARLSLGAALKWRWRRRGHCRGCGYDLTGNTAGVCPECGAPVHKGTIP